MHKLWEEYAGTNIEFLFVYCREPHPGRVYKQPATYEEKAAQARAFAEKYHSPMRVLVDEVDSRVQRLYGDLPNMAYVISKRGMIVYKSSWTRPPEIRSLLQNLLDGERARALGRPMMSSYTEKLEYNSPEWEARRLAESRRVLTEAGSDDIKLFNLEEVPGTGGVRTP